MLDRRAIIHKLGVENVKWLRLYLWAQRNGDVKEVNRLKALLDKNGKDIYRLRRLKEMADPTRDNQMN